MKKANIFIASSVEGLDVAYAIQDLLDFAAECTVWDQGVFEPSSYTLINLIETSKKSDYGIFVFSFEDTVKIRDIEQKAIRDNVLFELGLFVGALGKERCFIVRACEASDLHIPTDLLGITTITYNINRKDKNLSAALGPVANKIKLSLNKHGLKANDINIVYSLETNRHALFPEIIKNAKRISILCRTAINIVNMYSNDLVNSLQSGCDYRILVCNHKNDHILATYSKQFRNNSETAASFLIDLKNSYNGLSYKAMNKPIMCGLVWVEKEQEEDSFIQVLFYHYYAAKGNKRALINIYHNNDWYKVFTSEYESLWKDADDCQV